MDQALLILEREARYKAEEPDARRACSSTSSRPCRGTGSATARASRRWPPTRSTTRTGATTSSPLRARLGDVDFADLIYVRSAYFVTERRRLQPRLPAQVPDPLRREGGQDRPRQPGPRPALPVLGPAAPARLSRGPPPPPPRRGRGPHRPARTARHAAREPHQGRSRARSTATSTSRQFTVKPEDTAGPPAGWGIHSSIDGT